MPYTVSVDVEHRLIEVVYTGDITLSTRVCAMEDGAILLDSQQYQRVLVDLRAATAVPDRAEIGQATIAAAVHRPRMRQSRLAYLVLPDQHANALAETMAAARHPSLQQFMRREDAIEWLMQET